MDGIELQEKLESFGLSAREFAEFLCVTPTAVRQWIRGDRNISGLVEFFVFFLEFKSDFNKLFNQKEMLEKYIKNYQIGFDKAEEINFHQYLGQFQNNPAPETQLKEKRKWLSYTQKELATRLRVSTVAIQQWERGKRKISPVIIKGMFLVSKVRFYELIFGSLGKAFSEIFKLTEEVKKKSRRTDKKLTEQDKEFLRNTLFPQFLKLSSLLKCETNNEIRPEISAEGYHLNIILMAAGLTQFFEKFSK
jgi:transcriptional regulator with XRE-family HTH domain